MNAEPLTPWEAVNVAFEAMLDAIRTDPMHELPETKQAVRDYQRARSHANQVAPRAKPSRLAVEWPGKRGATR